MRLFSDVASMIPDPLLRRAFELAEEGRGLTSPNPLVGCVIAQDDVIVGEGVHMAAGGPHAEVEALREAGPAAAGATAYVTLEPCNHHGKTPPCSETLVTKGIARVVIGMADPNPVAVGGASRLREAGIEVEFAPDPRPFRIQNEEWLHALRTGRPFVRVKTALTLDGHPTVQQGVRSTITGAGGSDVTMRLRAASDAVVVGARTARIDDPSLTVRDLCGRPAERQPLRVVLGRSVPDAVTGMCDDGCGPVAVLLPQGMSAPEGMELVEYDPDEGLEAAMRALSARDVVTVLVEAGPELLTAFLESGVGDEYVFVHAGWCAGPNAPSACTRAIGREQAEACAVAPVETGILGRDAVTVWRPVQSTESYEKEMR